VAEQPPASQPHQSPTAGQAGTGFDNQSSWGAPTSHEYRALGGPVGASQPGQPWPQHPHQAPAAGAPQPSRGRKVASIVLFVFAGLVLLGQLSNLAQGGVSPENGAELLGWFIGLLLFAGLPILIGLRLRRPKK